LRGTVEADGRSVHDDDDCDNDDDGGGFGDRDNNENDPARTAGAVTIARCV